MRKILFSLIAVVGLGIGGCANNLPKNIDDIVAKELELIEEEPEFLAVYECAEQVSRVPYVSDPTNSLGEQIDIWKSPEQTLKEGGDCEDLSFLFAKLLHDNGRKGRAIFGAIDPLIKPYMHHVWGEYSGKKGDYIFELSATKPREVEYYLRGDIPIFDYFPMDNSKIIKKLGKYKKENNMEWLESNEFYRDRADQEFFRLNPWVTNQVVSVSE